MAALRIAVFSLLASTALTSVAFAQAPQLPPTVREYQAPPERQRPQTRPLNRGVTGLGQTQDVIREPRFMVEAVSFKAVDESGRDLPYTSDEVFAVFISEGRGVITMTRNFEANTGDLIYFEPHQTCIWPAIDPDGVANGRWACAPGGGRGPVRFSVYLLEDDHHVGPFNPDFNLFPGGGEADLGRRPDDPSNDTLFSHQFSYEVSDILSRLDPNCRCLVQTARQSVDSLTTYEFTFRITRVDDGRESPAMDAGPGAGGPPTPVTHASGTLTAGEGQGFELDAGSVVATGADLAFSRVFGVNALTPGAGARIWTGGASPRGYATCNAERMSANYVATPVAAPGVGEHACYLTSDGRVGELRVSSAGGGTLSIAYTTWQ